MALGLLLPLLEAPVFTFHKASSQLDAKFQDSYLIKSEIFMVWQTPINQLFKIQ